MRPIEEQVILITGATDGLGRAVATDLAGRGATLLLHGRNPARGQATLEEIRRATGSDTLTYYNADFASLAEVRGLAEHVRAHHGRLDALVNNAGLGVELRRQVSHDGHELTFQVDYLAPYILSHMLAPPLAAGAPARIVNVTSAGQADATIHVDDVMLERRYDGVQAYCQAKLAEVMLTFDTADALRDRGVTATCLHPASYMPTKMVVGLFSVQNSLADGVRSTVRLIADPALDGVTGRYYVREREERANPQAYDAAMRGRLRALAARLTGVSTDTRA